jgi:hypothetical protein
LWDWAFALSIDLFGSVDIAALALSPASFVDSATALPLSLTVGSTWANAAAAKVVATSAINNFFIVMQSPYVH